MTAGNTYPSKGNPTNCNLCKGNWQGWNDKICGQRIETAPKVVGAPTNFLSRCSNPIPAYFWVSGFSFSLAEMLLEVSDQSSCVCPGTVEGDEGDVLTDAARCPMILTSLTFFSEKKVL
jgi:hypothetical protein